MGQLFSSCCASICFVVVAFFCAVIFGTVTGAPDLAAMLFLGVLAAVALLTMVGHGLQARDFFRRDADIPRGEQLVTTSPSSRSRSDDNKIREGSVCPRCFAWSYRTGECSKCGHSLASR